MNKKKALSMMLARKAGARLFVPPSGKSYVWPTKIGRVRIK
jgi:hypothetical protein